MSTGRGRSVGRVIVISSASSDLSAKTLAKMKEIAEFWKFSSFSRIAKLTLPSY
jgi:hypothetical protein